MALHRRTHEIYLKAIFTWILLFWLGRVTYGSETWDTANKFDQTCTFYSPPSKYLTLAAQDVMAYDELSTSSGYLDTTLNVTVGNIDKDKVFIPWRISDLMLNELPHSAVTRRRKHAGTVNLINSNLVNKTLNGSGDVSVDWATIQGANIFPCSLVIFSRQLTDSVDGIPRGSLTIDEMLGSEGDNIAFILQLSDSNFPRSVLPSEALICDGRVPVKLQTEYNPILYASRKELINVSSCTLTISNQYYSSELTVDIGNFLRPPRLDDHVSCICQVWMVLTIVTGIAFIISLAVFTALIVRHIKKRKRDSSNDGDTHEGDHYQQVNCQNSPQSDVFLDSNISDTRPGMTFLSTENGVSSYGQNMSEYISSV